MNVAWIMKMMLKLVCTYDVVEKWSYSEWPAIIRSFIYQTHLKETEITF